MSTPVLRANRSLISSMKAVNCNFIHNISQKLTGNVHFVQALRSQIRPKNVHCANLISLDQSVLRTICSKFSTVNIKFQKSLEILSETQKQPSETNWSIALKGRLFTQSESEFYHNVLERLDAYSGTIYKDDPNFVDTYKLSDSEYKRIVSIKNWHLKPAPEIILAFVSLSVYMSKKQSGTIEDQQFETLLNAFVDKLALSTEKELIDCFVALKYWPLLNGIRDPHIHKVWKALDDVCFKRYLDWTTDKCIFMMDLWYHMGLIAQSFFVYKALNKVSRKTEEFTAAQMVQSLFYMSCTRKISANIAVREYEYYIQQYITKLSVDEIGIFALAFFKTKTQILNKKILMYIMQRTVEEVDNIHSITLTSIAKAVRFSHTPDIGFTANDMVTKLIERRWKSLSLINGVHIVHISTQIQFYNEEALTQLAEKFCNNPSKARLKDMERIAFFLSLYNFIPPSTPNVCDIIVEQLNLPKREKEANSYPLFYLSLVYFLSILQVFPEKHIQRAVNEDYLNSLYESKYQIPQQAVQLDYNRVMEGPAGSEHLLSPKLREYLARRYSKYLPDGTHPIKFEFDKLMSQVMKLTDELLGKENNLATFTLPHFPRGDILFRLDDNGNPLPIPEEMKNLAEFEDVHRPVGPGKWYCVVIGGRNMYMHNVPRLVGEQEAKLRQLQSLGYTPIMIPSYYWKKEEDKMAYLRLKYFNNHKPNK